MECRYKEVETKEIIVENDNISWKCFFRQWYICTGLWTIYFLWGLVFGAPTVFIPQLRREANSTAAVSEEMASWLMSIFSYTAIIGAFVLPILASLLGRKTCIIIVAFNTLIGFIIFYCSTNITLIFISEMLQGVAASCCLTIAIIIIAECTSPKYRGFFSSMKGASFYWGIWFSNVIGTFSHWKNIGAFGLVCCSYMLTIFLWPESPHWLASKGRFDECAKAHRWLKGTDKNSERELERLINSQKEFLANRAEHKSVTLRKRVEVATKTMMTGVFYKPVLLSMLVNTLYHFSGKMVCSMYAIDIIRKITDSESTAYTGMLILDGVTVFGMYIGCALARFVRRRTMLLSFSSIGVLILLIISLYLYLVKLSIFSENKIVSLLLLTVFSLTISCGPMILSTTIYSEIMPLRFKSSCLILIGCYTQTLMATILKISPYIFRTFEMHGAFLFYGVSASVCIFFLYKYLPETKDKTLQEIEEYFTDKRRESQNEEIDEGKELMNINNIVAYHIDKDCT